MKQRKKNSVILSLPKDQLRNDTSLREDIRRSDSRSATAAIFRGLILRQAQDDGLFNDQISRALNPRAHARGYQRRRQQGMVLLEAIIALTIFAMVVVGLVLALDASLTAADERDQVDSALRGLQNQIELLHAGRVNPVDKDLDDDGSGYTYHLTVEPEQMTDQKNQPVAGMYRATVTVKWKTGKQAQERSLSELIYQP